MEQLKLSGPPSTCDAWYIDNSQNWYLIEFKSGKFSFSEYNLKCPECKHPLNFMCSVCDYSSTPKYNKSKNEILLKCTESLLIICELTNKTIEFTRKNLKFVLVVEDNSSLVDIHRHTIENEKGPYTPEAISRLKKMYFNDA